MKDLWLGGGLALTTRLKDSQSGRGRKIIRLELNFLKEKLPQRLQIRPMQNFEQKVAKV